MGKDQQGIGARPGMRGVDRMSKSVRVQLERASFELPFLLVDLAHQAAHEADARGKGGAHLPEREDFPRGPFGDGGGARLGVHAGIPWAEKDRSKNDSQFPPAIPAISSSLKPASRRPARMFLKPVLSLNQAGCAGKPAAALLPSP